MSTEQQYRVIGKSGQGVEPVVGKYYRWGGVARSVASIANGIVVFDDGTVVAPPGCGGSWDRGEVDILEAISPPQAAPVVCLAWCGLPVSHRLVPAPSQATRFFACIFPNGCHGKDCGGHRAYCTQACLDRAKAAKTPQCIRSACKAPPVAGGELCAAHAGQVEAAKATAPPPAETRLERWRREHKGYSHGTADPRIHDANVAAMMVGRDGPREPYVPPPKLPAWTPRDLDGDIPDAWEPGGARLGGAR